MNGVIKRSNGEVEMRPNSEFRRELNNFHRRMSKPKFFTMFRKNDASGFSGTGRVLDGVIFHTGIVVVCWRSRVSSVCVYESFEHFKAIHVNAHQFNKSNIVWLE